VVVMILFVVVVSLMIMLGIAVSFATQLYNTKKKKNVDESVDIYREEDD
jgi:uncharacterized membrane protein